MTKITASIRTQPAPPSETAATAKANQALRAGDHEGAAYWAARAMQARAQTSAERRDACFAAIDAMSAEIDRLRDAHRKTIAEYWGAHAESIAHRDERDRYRAALERIADLKVSAPLGDWYRSGDAQMRDIAQRALGRE